MKLLVMSDSHGSVDNMLRAAELEKPDAVIHLGDCWRDAERFQDRLPDLCLYQVPGNCDYRSGEDTERLLLLEGKRILICHGHTYRVKQGLRPAILAAMKRNLDAFLFGHTHLSFCDYGGKTLYLNPGTIGGYGSRTYAVMTVENDGVKASIHVLS